MIEEAQRRCGKTQTPAPGKHWVPQRGSHTRMRCSQFGDLCHPCSVTSLGINVSMFRPTLRCPERGLCSRSGSSEAGTGVGLGEDGRTCPVGASRGPPSLVLGSSSIQWGGRGDSSYLARLLRSLEVEKARTLVIKWAADTTSGRTSSGFKRVRSATSGEESTGG